MASVQEDTPQLDESKTNQQYQVDSMQLEDQNREQTTNPVDLQYLQARRPSFVRPFPGPITSSAQGSPTPLTNHEIYELIQKNQHHHQVAGAGAATSQAGQPSSVSRGSFKRAKRPSQFVSRQHELERQNSVIVGTPGFRERYGE